MIDEAGEPVVGVALRALALTFTGGRRHFAPSGPAATTDDRGMYRFSSLAPGEYLVVTSPPTVAARANILTDVARTGRGSGEIVPIVPGTPNGMQVGDALISLGRGGVIPPPPVGGHLQVYPSTFYPSAFMPAQATTITLGAGEERSGIDIQLQPVSTVRMSGTLIGPSGPASMATVRLIPAGVEEIGPDGLAPATFADATGTFIFPAVVPAQYSLRSTTRENPQNLFWIDMPITISGGDVDGVIATMRPGLRIAGHLEFEGTTPRPTGPPQRPTVTVSIALEHLGGAVLAAPSSTAWNEQGFVLSGYSAGKYLVRVSGSPVGWMFKSALLNGVDVSETPFELTRDVTDLVITFSDRWSGLSGSVQGAGADAAAVIVFPTDPQGWIDCGTNPRRVRNARATAQGRFGINSLPAGDYYALAVPEEQTADWRDPRTLEALARVATRITILDGEHRTIDLPLREVKQ